MEVWYDFAAWWNETYVTAQCNSYAEISQNNFAQECKTWG